MAMKTQMTTKNAPSAIGPYSQGIQAGKTVYISGQLPVSPETGAMCEGPIGDCTRQCLKNLEGIVREAGGTLADVVKVTVFLTDMADFGAVNEVYADFFPTPAPARSAFAVAKLPLNGRIEIEAIALIPGGE
jgi:2-iminobutanoate/2-iminopropanoate deaminase